MFRWWWNYNEVIIIVIIIICFYYKLILNHTSKTWGVPFISKRVNFSIFNIFISSEIIFFRSFAEDHYQHFVVYLARLFIIFFFFLLGLVSKEYTFFFLNHIKWVNGFIMACLVTGMLSSSYLNLNSLRMLIVCHCGCKIVSCTSMVSMVRHFNYVNFNLIEIYLEGNGKEEIFFFVYFFFL